MFEKFKDILTQSGRSGELKRNIVGLFGIKGGMMVLELAKVPIILDFLSKEEYGIWLTLVSMVLWVQNFDVGLGAGLRYKLAESFAKKNGERAKTLVSTAYFSLAGIMLFVGLVLFPVGYFINWDYLLNASNVSNLEIGLSFCAILIAFLIQFVLGLICYVYQASQKAAMGEIFRPIGSAISLILIIICSQIFDGSLLLASVLMAFPYVLVLLIANIKSFRGIFRNISPNIKFYRRDTLKDIYSIGFKFFVNSLSALIVFTTANVLLSHYINPEEVSVYSTSFTYFGLTLTFMNMAVIAMSAPITEAFVTQDLSWIRKLMRKSILLASTFVGCNIIMILMVPWVFNIWTHGKIQPPLDLSIALATFNSLAVFAVQFTYFLGAVGRMKVNMIISTVKIIVFLPIAILCIKALGVIGLVCAIIVINTLPNLIFGKIQYTKLMSGTATGIWNK